MDYASVSVIIFHVQSNFLRRLCREQGLGSLLAESLLLEVLHEVWIDL